MPAVKLADKFLRLSGLTICTVKYKKMHLFENLHTIQNCYRCLTLVNKCGLTVLRNVTSVFVLFVDIVVIEADDTHKSLGEMLKTQNQ